MLTRPLSLRSWQRFCAARWRADGGANLGEGLFVSKKLQLRPQTKGAQQWRGVGFGVGVKRGWDWGGEGGGHHINSCPRRLELFGPFAVGCASLTQRSRSCTMFSAGLRLCLCHSSVLRTGETSSDIIRRLCCGELTSAGASPLTDKAFNNVVFHMFFMPLY